MKKLFVISTIFVMGFLGKNAIAQDDGPNDNPGGFGFKGGIGLTTISFETDDASDQRNRMKVGGLVGLSYEKRFGDLFALDIEFDVVNRGSKWTSDDILVLENTYVVKNNILALDIPLSAKIYIGNNFNVNVGPYFSTTVAAWNRSYTKTPDGDKINKQDSKNYFSDDFEDADGDRYLNRFDVGLNAGLEFVTNGGFGVGARFQKGFLDMTNNDYLLGDNKRVTNTGIQIYAIVRL